MQSKAIEDAMVPKFPHISEHREEINRTISENCKHILDVY
jgi:hypothetical protein